MTFRCWLCALLLISLIVSTNESIAWSADWDEEIDGDLSNDRMSPTFIPLTAGSNILRATTGGLDFIDYFTFTLADGQELSSLMHRSYIGVDRLAFISIMSGTQFTVSPNNPEPGNMLGWTHFGRGEGNVGTDLLPLIGRGPGSQGFTPPLPSGSYSVWLQQQGSSTEYELEWIVTGGPPGVIGDFDGDGMWTAADIDALSEAIRAGSDSEEFDVNGDGQVNSADRGFWINDIVNTYVGDSNLDREFNSGDLVEVFQAGQYEDSIPLNSTWVTGDWDGDGDFTSTDFIDAFQQGGYETGPRAAVANVPEPSSALLLALAWIAIQLPARRIPNPRPPEFPLV